MQKIVAIACVMIELFAYGSGHARIVTTQKVPIYVDKANSLTTFEFTDCWDGEGDVCIEGSDVGSKIAIFGGAFVGKQVTLLRSAAYSTKLHFADVDGDGVRELVFFGADSKDDDTPQPQIFRIGERGTFKAIRVYEPALRDAFETVSLRTPWSFNQEWEFLRISHGAAVYAWLGSDELDRVGCYLFEAGAIRRFASFGRNTVDPRTTFIGSILVPGKRKVARGKNQSIAVTSRWLALPLPRGTNAEAEAKLLCTNARAQYEKARQGRVG